MNLVKPDVTVRGSISLSDIDNLIKKAKRLRRLYIEVNKLADELGLQKNFSIEYNDNQIDLKGKSQPSGN